jgi:MFS family permease
MRRIHYAWVVAAVAFVALVGAAAFRAAPGPLMVPLHDELGWSITTMSAAVSVNLVLYGLTAPFAAALMERFGLRRVTSVALVLIAAGAGLSALATAAWQLMLTWGLLVGLGTGSMALVFAATVANAWFVQRRGLVMGILTAGGAAGQLVFLPLVAYLATTTSWQVASLLVAAVVLTVLPLVVVGLRDRPSDLGLPPCGGTTVLPTPIAAGSAIRAAIDALRDAARTRAFWALAGAFAICGATTNGLVGIHFVPSAHDHGMATTTAAGLLAVVGIFDIIGTVASGWLTDRVDAKLLVLAYYMFRGSDLSCCRGCCRRASIPAWCCLSWWSTDLTGWPPCLPPSCSADAFTALGAPSCSAGSSPPTSSARLPPHLPPGWCATPSARTTMPGSAAPPSAR